MKKCKEVTQSGLYILFSLNNVHTTHFHGNPSSAGSCVQHNDLSGRLSVPVSVSQLSTPGRLTSPTLLQVKAGAPLQQRTIYFLETLIAACTVTYPKYV